MTQDAHSCKKTHACAEAENALCCYGRVPQFAREVQGHVQTHSKWRIPAGGKWSALPSAAAPDQKRNVLLHKHSIIIIITKNTITTLALRHDCWGHMKILHFRRYDCQIRIRTAKCTLESSTVPSSTPEREVQKHVNHHALNDND
jgi:hypothetical protein